MALKISKKKKKDKTQIQPRFSLTKVDGKKTLAAAAWNSHALVFNKLGTYRYYTKAGIRAVGLYQ